MIIEFKIFENLSIKDRILTYLLMCLKNDKHDYKYVWNDTGWLYSEFINFIEKEYTSYIYAEFHNKYEYDVIENILIEEYPVVYGDALYTTKGISLKNYLINKDVKKYNL